MSENQNEGISDEQLPEDLQPSEDNPLAEPLDDDVDVEDLEMDGGKTPEESDEDGSDDGSEEGSDNESDQDGDD